MATLFHNQFIIGPRQPDGYNSWQKFSLFDNYYLFAHPNLTVENVQNDTVSVCLIGYILDPDNPKASSADVIKSIIDNVNQGVDLFKAIENLGGRFVLIFKDSRQIKLIHDAAGLRQVFYSDSNKHDELWCASQPNHIAKIFDIEMDHRAVDFITYFQNKDKEYWWPGDSSPYDSIKRLLPNHYLDLLDGRAIRFWPKQKPNRIRLDEAILTISNTLSRMIESAAHRFDLSLGLSAGWDSRLMLSASKTVAEKIRFYTGIKVDFDVTHPDIAIPTQLATKLGLNHHLFHVLPNATSEFAEVFNQQTPFAHQTRLAPLYTHLKDYGRKRVGTTGNVSEIARCYYRPFIPTKKITSDFLIKATGANHSFAQEHYHKWIKSTNNFRFYNILDLFYWEQRIGSWFAQNCLEFDTAWLDIFIPFNNRKLLTDMLSVSEHHRKGPSYRLYVRLMKHLWPEVLSYPINPHKPKKGLAFKLKIIKSSIEKRFFR